MRLTASSGESPAAETAHGPSKTKTNKTQAAKWVRARPLFPRGVLCSFITDVILFRYSGLIKLFFQQLGKQQSGAIGSGVGRSAAVATPQVWIQDCVAASDAHPAGQIPGDKTFPLNRSSREPSRNFSPSR